LACLVLQNRARKMGQLRIAVLEIADCPGGLLDERRDTVVAASAQTRGPDDGLAGLLDFFPPVFADAVEVAGEHVGGAAAFGATDDGDRQVRQPDQSAGPLRAVLALDNGLVIPELDVARENTAVDVTRETQHLLVPGQRRLKRLLAVLV